MQLCGVCGQEPKEKLYSCKYCGTVFCERHEDDVKAMLALGVCAACEEVWESEDVFDIHEIHDEEYF